MVRFKRWFVVSSHPHREEAAARNLTAQGFAVYLPMTARRVRHARTVTDTARPLFPGYLFVGQQPEAGRLRAINGTVGVRSVVSFGATPALLPSGFIESIRAREVEGVIPSDPSLAPGQDVEVSEGPFAGVVGTILELREKDRLILLLDFASRSTKLSIEASRVLPC